MTSSSKTLALSDSIAIRGTGTKADNSSNYQSDEFIDSNDESSEAGAAGEGTENIQSINTTLDQSQDGNSFKSLSTFKNPQRNHSQAQAEASSSSSGINLWNDLLNSQYDSPASISNASDLQQPKSATKVSEPLESSPLSKESSIGSHPVGQGPRNASGKGHDVSFEMGGQEPSFPIFDSNNGALIGLQDDRPHSPVPIYNQQRSDGKPEDNGQAVTSRSIIPGPKLPSKLSPHSKASEYVDLESLPDIDATSKLDTHALEEHGGALPNISDSSRPNPRFFNKKASLVSRFSGCGDLEQMQSDDGQRDQTRVAAQNSASESATRRDGQRWGQAMSLTTSGPGPGPTVLPNPTAHVSSSSALAIIDHSRGAQVPSKEPSVNPIRNPNFQVPVRDQQAQAQGQASLRKLFLPKDKLPARITQPQSKLPARVSTDPSMFREEIQACEDQDQTFSVASTSTQRSRLPLLKQEEHPTPGLVQSARSRPGPRFETTPAEDTHSPDRMCAPTSPQLQSFNSSADASKAASEGGKREFELVLYNLPAAMWEVNDLPSLVDLLEGWQAPDSQEDPVDPLPDTAKIRLLSTRTSAHCTLFTSEEKYRCLLREGELEFIAYNTTILIRSPQADPSSSPSMLGAPGSSKQPAPTKPANKKVVIRGFHSESDINLDVLRARLTTKKYKGGLLEGPLEIFRPRRGMPFVLASFQNPSDARNIVEYASANPIPYPNNLSIHLEAYFPMAVRPEPVPTKCEFLLKNLSPQEHTDMILEAKLEHVLENDTDDFHILYRNATGDTAILRFTKPKELETLKMSLNGRQRRSVAQQGKSSGMAASGTPQIVVEHLVPTASVQIYNLPKKDQQLLDAIESLIENPKLSSIETPEPVRETEWLDNPLSLILTFFDFKDQPKFLRTYTNLASKLGLKLFALPYYPSLGSLVPEACRCFERPPTPHDWFVMKFFLQVSEKAAIFLSKFERDRSTILDRIRKSLSLNVDIKSSKSAPAEIYLLCVIDITIASKSDFFSGTSSLISLTDWIKSGQEKLREFFENNLISKSLTLKPDLLPGFKEQLVKTIQGLPLLASVNEETMTYEFFGMTEQVNSLYKEYSVKIQQQTDQVTEMLQLQPSQFFYLKINNEFLKSVSGNQVTISINNINRAIRLVGARSAVKPALDRIKDTLLQLVNRIEKLPAPQVRLLEDKKIKENVQERVKEADIKFMWQVDESVNLASMSDDAYVSVQLLAFDIADLEIGLGILNNALPIKTGEIFPDSVFLVKEALGRQSLERYLKGTVQSQFFLTYSSDSSKYTLYAFEADIEQLTENIDGWFDGNTILTTQMACDMGIARYMSRYMTPHIVAIQKDLTLHSLEILVNKLIIEFRGVRSSIDNATARIQSLMASIVSEKLEQTKPIVCKWLRKKGHREAFALIENERQCIIEYSGDQVVSASDSNAAANASSLGSRPKATRSAPAADASDDFMDFEDLSDSGTFASSLANPPAIFEHKIGGTKLLVYENDIRNHAAHVLVTFTDTNLGNPYKTRTSILENAGIQVENELQVLKSSTLHPGELLTTKGGDMPNIRTIIHLVLSFDKDSMPPPARYRELHNGLLNALRHANDQLHGAVVAFTAFASPNYQIEKVIHENVDAVEEYLGLNSSTNQIKEIHFVDQSNKYAMDFVKEINLLFELNALPAVTPSFAPPLSFASIPSSPATSLLPMKPPPLLTDQFLCSNGAMIKLVKGGIDQQQVAIIVNTCSADLNLHHGAVSNAILNAAGQIIQSEVKRSKPQGLQPWEIVQSSSGQLNANGVQLILHTSLGQWSNTNLSTLLQNLLTHADRIRSRSIAIPALGTGNLHFPADQVAKCMYESVLAFDRASPSSTLKDIRFVVYPGDKATCNAFEMELASRLGLQQQQQPLPPPPPSLPTQVTDVKPLRLAPEAYQAEQSKSRDSAVTDMEASIANLTVVIAPGDITKETTDAIVNSIDENFTLAGHVSQAIIRNGGQVIFDACKALPPHSTKATGVVSTTKGELPCKKCILHMVSPPKDDPKLWEKAIKHVLREADRLGLESISFPAIGTGVHGGSFETIASAALDAIAEYAEDEKPKSLRLIRMVIFQKKMLATFRNELERKVAEAEQGHTKHGRFHRWMRRTINAAMRFLGGGPSSTSDSLPRGTSPKLSKPAETQKQSRLKEPPGEYVQVYARDDTTLTSAKKQLLRHFDSLTFSDTFKGAVHFLTKSFVEDMRTKYTVECEVGNDNEHVVITGLKDDVLLVMVEIQKTIANASQEKELLEKADILAKSIVWEYEEKHNEFLPYDSVSNYKIETQFKSASADNSLELTFIDVASKQPYKIEIDLANMIETDQRNANKRNIKRNDLTMHDKSLQIPTSWQKLPPGQFYVRVELAPSTPEYQTVEAKFRLTVQNKIIKIWSIQNPELYQKYMVHKNNMEKREKGGRLKPPQGIELKLFHGTSEDTLESINVYGFNRSYCGKNAVAYGNGVYFARDASYSANTTYSRPNASGERFMYMANVLVGEYAQGQSGIRVPPMKPTKELFDCVVDHPASPGMFVIFNDTQAYPEFLIQFQ